MSYVHDEAHEQARKELRDIAKDLGNDWHVWEEGCLGCDDWRWQFAEETDDGLMQTSRWFSCPIEARDAGLKILFGINADE